MTSCVYILLQKTEQEHRPSARIRVAFGTFFIC